MSETIPVLWVSRYSHILARGYADQGLTEAILDRTLWRPPGAFTFEHHLVVEEDFPPVEGAVVIISPRHHVDDWLWLDRQINRLAWSVLILSSDEEWVFPWDRIVHDEHHKLWVSQPRPEHASADALIPCGWYPGTREGIKAASAPGMDRKLDWFFAGQVTHVRRDLCVAALERLQDEGETTGLLVKTEGYLQRVLSEADYFARLAETKVVPCPSGPQSTCTARTEEALEAGCIPVCDLVKPHDPQFDYWTLLFGEGHPIPTVYAWDDFEAELGPALDGWPYGSNRCWSFWQQWKRAITKQLDADLHAARGTTPVLDSPDDLVTVIVTTSPAPLHPSTEHLEETIRSVREQLPDAEIIIVADGVRPEQSTREADYDDYLQRLCWLTNFEWHNVVPVLMDDWVHQANCVAAALDLVDTPLVLFVEHDTPLLGPIDWPGLCALLTAGTANVVRFHPEVSVHDEHEGGMLEVSGLSDWVQHAGFVRATSTWWARPNLARVDFWRDRIMPNFPPECRTFIEDPFYGIVKNDFSIRGDAAWWDWRIFMYDPDPNEVPHLGIKRSWHLDSRGDDPKYPMWLRDELDQAPAIEINIAFQNGDTGEITYPEEPDE